MNKKRKTSNSGTIFLCYLLSICAAIYTTPKVVNKISEKKYSYEYELYNDAVTQIKDLFQSLELENATQCFYIFTYLLNEGYLSLNKNFCYETNLTELKDIHGLLGYDVILGKACCRHISDLFNDILLACGYDSCIISCKTNGNLNINHVINVVNDNGEIKYFDPTNSLILDKDGNDLVTIKALNSSDLYKLVSLNPNDIFVYNNFINWFKINKSIILDTQELNYVNVLDDEIKAYEIANDNADKVVKFIDSYQQELLDKNLSHNM